MRLELNIHPNSTLNDGCKVPSRALGELLEPLSKLDLPAGGGSNQIKAILQEPAVYGDWELDFLVSPQATRDYPDAHLKINYLWVSSDCQCNRRHKIFVHRCFDNRQAIGTNLMRFMVADKSPTKSSNDDYAFVALVADRGAKQSAWDGAIGAYEEYFFAVNGGYQVLEIPPLDFAIIRG